MNCQVLINTGQLQLASALLQEILLLLKPLLVDLPNVQPTSLMKTVSEATVEMDIAGTTYSRSVLSYSLSPIFECSILCDIYISIVCYK
jgi:hypothetical protein